MTNQINKIFIIFSYLLLSLIISGCTEGDRNFVAIPEEPVEELDADIFVTGGAVKGPLVNAEINIYKFELDQGPLYLLNNALNVWFNLLDENQIQLEDDSYTLGDLSEEVVVDNLLDSINQFGYVTELKSLKSKLNEATDFTAATTLVNDYIATEETNKIVKDEVQKIFDSAATLSGLQRDVNDLETLTDKLLDADSFSAARNLLREYRAKESSDDKLDGFTYVLAKADLLANQASQFSVSSIRHYYTENIYDVFLNEFSLQNDPVARQHIVELKDSLASAATVIDAESLIEDAYRKEGNELIKAALAKLLSKILTIADLHDLIVGYDAFYHDFSLRSSILGPEPTEIEPAPAPAPKPSFKDLFELITNTFQDHLGDAFRGSLIIKDDAGENTNRLSFGVTNSQGILPGLVIGQYRGFVYMEAIASSGTIDLNSGSEPIIEKMGTIFHTDDILGNGDNTREDETLYFILNGEIQRDSDGELITDVSLIDNGSQDKLLTIRTSFFATPLTDLAIGLSIEKLKNISALKGDIDADLLPDNKITEAVLKNSLQTSAHTISETFGIGLTDQNLYRSSPIRLTEMQYTQDSELQAIQYRLSIENYSSFLYELMNITNLKASKLVDLLAKDLTDNQIDGLNKKEKVAELSDISYLQYLLKIDPSERLVPGTPVPVSNVYYLMNQQHSQLLPDEALGLFTARNADLTINAPKGGTDSDLDGVLDNEDQFPEDPTKSRDLNPGYPGIWSLNYDNSETEYMPFNDPLVLRFTKEQVEGLCTLEPCVGLGNISTNIKASFKLISAPENNDYTEIPQNDDSELSFSAFATTPGNYLVKAELISEVEPVQSYTFYIPIQVVDPKSIQIKFDPVEPQPGKPITVKFKATKALCSLYPICGEINLNDGDEENDFLPLSQLNDIFSVNQQVERKSTTLAYTSVASQNEPQNLSNIELNDTVNLSVSFNAGNRSLVAASYNKVVGGDQDSDNDGVSDLNDFYPLDALCYLEKDGILDENSDGELNELDSPYCFEGIQAAAEPEPLDVNFLNETWFSYPDKHLIVRKNKYTSGYNGYIKTPTLQGTRGSIKKFKVDEVSKRVYFAYKNGAIDYYSLESQSIVEFSPSYAFSPVKSMNLLGTYLLIEYGAGVEAKLFNKDASLAVIGTDSAYPFPGNAVTLNIDKQNLISATNNLLTLDWVLERESNVKDDNGDYIVDVLPVLTTNDELTLSSGQTVFGDVVKVALNFITEDDRTIQLIKNIFVLGINSISFSDNTFESDKDLSIVLADFNSDVLSTNNTSLYVKWFKNDGSSDDFSFVLTETRYPFIFKASNFELGDIIRGDIYFKYAENDLLISSLEAHIAGDLDRFVPTLNSDESIFDNTTRNVNLTLMKPTINYREFDQETFTPLWKINDAIIEGETLFTFPTLDSTIISYGDVVSVSYSYSLNGVVGETEDLPIGDMEFNTNTSIFTLDYLAAEVGQDISLKEGQFSDDELETIEGRWRINGIFARDEDQPKNKDTGEYEFFNLLTFPGSKLSYGDEVELLLIPAGRKDLELLSDHIAKASVGLNLISLANNQIDPDNDLDSDQDGIPNHLDYFRNDAQCSIAGEGVPDDIDFDGISDLDELTGVFITSPSKVDTDNDGLSDYEEVDLHLTDPTNPDSDGDGYLDGVEIDLGTDPNITNSSVNDNDFDGLSNTLELSYKTKVNVSDTDGDGLSDWLELNIQTKYPSSKNTNPLLVDSDGDKLSDGAELRMTFTDPNVADTDGDGINDGIEVVLKLNPNSQDTNDDGILDADELGFDFNVTIPSVLFQDDLKNYKTLADSDGDKLLDVIELRVTFTDPNNADTDGDGIKDGIEVVLELNPNSQDTDDNGILDADEPKYDFNVAIPSDLFQDVLKNYASNFSNLLNIEQGTCFKTWLANNKPAFVNNTHNSQLDSTSTQEVAFASDDWNQIIRFDATNMAFSDLIKLNIYDAKVTSINYDAVNSEILYIGFSDGWIRQYYAQTKQISDIFNTDRNVPITTIVVHDEFLIAEQIDEDSQIHHSVFDLAKPLDENPKSSLVSDYSYKNSIWLDDSALSRLELISFDENFSSSSFIVETINPALESPVVSSEIIALSGQLESPLFIEQLNAKDILNFANGRSYNLSDNALLANEILPFGFGLEHQNHRIVSQENSSFLEMTTLSDLHEGKFWSLNTQLSHKNLLSVVPVGFHLLAISKSEPSKPNAQDGKIAFQYIELGDESGDSLPDWWNNLSESLTVAEYTNYELTGDADIPDLLDGTPNVDDSLTDPELLDTDGDGICDHWETALFNTNPLVSDTDGDGATDAQELNIDTTVTLDCKNYPVFNEIDDPLNPDKFLEGFNIISDPLNPDSDGDGLEDGAEVYTNTIKTEPLNPDTDGDGLTDYQELFITNTNPLNKFSNGQDIDGSGDFDNDGLIDAEEINIYKTDPQNKDSDGDTLDDGKEVLEYGSNPNVPDTDKDGLSDADEIIGYKTDPNDSDTDLDGLSDFDEIKNYKSDPLKPDTDYDGLSDFDEFNFEYEYSDDQLEIIGNPELKSSPVKYDTDLDGICDKWEVLNFLSNPAESDTDGDGLTDAQELGIIIDPSMIGSEDNSLSSPESCLSLPVTQPISSHLTRDTDGDRILDGDEVLVLFTDPKDLDSNDNNVNDDLEDPDQDGLNNYQELYLTLTDPLNPDSDGNGINDGDDDSDGDGLSNKDEINIHGTDPLNVDSDGDGINDKEEFDNNLNSTLLDTDGDGLSDSDEINIYDTDPNHPDTDRDGSTDHEEVKLKKTDPNNPDSDNDFLLDGADPQPLVFDIDLDGIPDGIEVNYLGTDPKEVDSDLDGLSDGYETWVFAFSYDSATELETNELMRIGEDLDQDLNSHAGTPGWPTLVNGLAKFNENNLDRLVVDLVDVLDSSFIKGRLYIQRYSNPATADSDGDGLFDSTEFEIERVYGVDYNESLSQTVFDPLATNFDPLASNFYNFKLSNPWSIDSNSGKDSDGDGIPDVYEIALTKTDPFSSDTDNDGIIDSLENEDFDLLNNIEEVRFGSNSLVFEGVLDSDNDGLIDVFENLLFSQTGDLYDPFNADSNNNGIADGDEDIDQDLLTNLEELKFETDPLTKDFGLDSDGDGLSNFQELFATLTDPFKADTDDNGTLDGAEDFDNDGLDNIRELSLGSNPYVSNTESNIADSDNDGLTDFQEITFTQTNPDESNSDSNELTDANEDLDSDGLSNFQEMKLGTNPLVKDSYQLKRDSDNDGLVDVYEIELTLTDPNNVDSDGDGVSDLLNNKDGDLYSDFQEMLLGADPDVVNDYKVADSDNDGLTDFQELNLTNTNPNLADTDADGTPDALEDDEKNDEGEEVGDGFTHIEELMQGTDPLEIANNQGALILDTDQDGLTDYQEINITKTNPELQDSDGNGISDGAEDADNDKVSNLAEVKLGTDPLNANSFSFLSFQYKDSDKDGLSDYQETYLTFTNPTNPDTNNNGINDGQEDSDGDGISNLSEVVRSSDPRNRDIVLDTDGDGLSDYYELNVTGTDINLPDSDNNGINDGDEDPDNDGIPDKLEFKLFTDPAVAEFALDSDSDGLTDYQEINLTLTDPQSEDSDGNGVNDRLEDPDGDLISNLQELRQGTNPLVNSLRVDTDSDGLTDFQENSMTLNDDDIPLLNYRLKDTDRDGIIDSLEDSDSDKLTNLFEFIIGTDPLTPNMPLDSDGDGLSDYQEIMLTMTDPALVDSDGNGINDNLEDPDEDKIPNFLEVLRGSDPLSSELSGLILDTDGDGLTDYQEVRITKTNPLLKDSDGNGIEDGQEDLDNDKLSNLIEALNGSDPFTPSMPLDTDGDGLSDYQELTLTKTSPLLADTDDDERSDAFEDDDQDGITNIDELRQGTDPFNDLPLLDSDLDGLTDYQETYITMTNPLLKDSDGDGIEDGQEDPDNDKVTNLNEVIRGSDPLVAEMPLDSDLDGLSDFRELKLTLTNLFSKDTNNDGVEDGQEDFDNDQFTNLFELTLGTNPFIPELPLDSDGDGLTDYQELTLTLTDPLLKDSDGDGIDDNNVDADNDKVSHLIEVRRGSNPFVSELAELALDSDGDGLTDYQESLTLTDKLKQDSDSDGTRDDLEDLDNDGISNIDEMRFGSNPLVKYEILDTDNDGLSDYQETRITLTNPKQSDSYKRGVSDKFADSDNDGIPNFYEAKLGMDPNSVDNSQLIIDTDSDGLPDYIETSITNTDPAKADTDDNGVNDADEDLDGDQLTHLQEVRFGSDPANFEDFSAALDTDGDGLPDFIERKVTFTNPFKIDSDSNGVSDYNEDFDLDGLTNHLELMLGSDPSVKNIALDSDGDLLTDVQENLLTLTDPGLLDSDGDGIADGAEDFDQDTLTNLQEISLGNDPYLKDILDADEDADGDFFINLKEQVNGIETVAIQDEDGDLILDGIEALLLNTDIFASDTDGDGLNDSSEINTLSVREIPSNEFCSGLEIRLSSVAGKDYCFTIEYKSYPTLIDSDNDGVADRSVNESDNSIVLDHFPLDASCSLASDGFTKNDDNIQCFSSWMGESESIDIIKQAEWVDTSNADDINHADILFYSSGWDSIVVYNALTETYGTRISIKEEINSLPVSLIDFDFSKTAKLVYLLYSDSTIETYNVQTGLVQTLLDRASDGAPSSLKVLNVGRLLLETEVPPLVDEIPSYKVNLYLLEDTGGKSNELLDQSIEVKDALSVCTDLNADCNESVSIYGFIKDSAGSNINLGRLDIDLLANTFATSISTSSILSGADINGPIKLSQDAMSIQLGSGQIVNLELEDAGSDLSRVHNNKTYDSYFDFAEYADHFVGVVDVDLTNIPGGEDVLNAQNGLMVAELESIKDTLQDKLPGDGLINDLKELNQYLLPPQKLEEQVLKLIPFVKTPSNELALVKKSNKNIVIENLGLFDEDADLMTGIYEKVFGLNDGDASDKFSDLDEDGLTNIEEYFFATDPSKEDTDNDGWFDIYEILNGTDPNNNLSF